MPQAAKQIADEKSPAAASIEVKKKPTPPPSKFARQVYQRVNDTLESHLERFVEDSNLEEKRLMNEILEEWDQRSGFARPRGLNEYEVPLYGAIQRQMDDSLCVVVPAEDFIEPVEEFIKQLDRRGYRRKPVASHTRTDQQLREDFQFRFRTESELFARDAGLPSLRLMLKIVARWNELERDPEAEKIPNVLAAAAEIELDKLRASNAVEAAEK